MAKDRDYEEVKQEFEIKMKKLKEYKKQMAVLKPKIAKNEVLLLTMNSGFACIVIKKIALARIL